MEGDDQTKRRKSSEAGRKPCKVSNRTGRCGRSKEHDSHPEVCGWRRKGVSGSDTCHRTDGYPRSDGIKPPRYTGPVNSTFNNYPYQKHHRPANKGVHGYHPKGYEGPDFREAAGKTGRMETYKARGGARKGKKRGANKKSFANKRCAVKKSSGRCGSSKEHNTDPQLCGKRRKNYSGEVSCYRKDHPRDVDPPRYTGPSPYRKGHRPANKGLHGYHTKGHKGPSTRNVRGIRSLQARARGRSVRNRRGGSSESGTSSTRSSDFTSVSNTTSYSMTGGSFTSNDDTSLW